MDKIETVLYVMADKFLESAEKDELMEVIGMTRLGQMLVNGGKALLCMWGNELNEYGMESHSLKYRSVAFIILNFFQTLGNNDIQSKLQNKFLPEFLRRIEKNRKRK